MPGGIDVAGTLCARVPAAAATGNRPVPGRRQIGVQGGARWDGSGITWFRIRGIGALNLRVGTAHRACSARRRLPWIAASNLRGPRNLASSSSISRTGRSRRSARTGRIPSRRAGRDAPRLGSRSGSTVAMSGHRTWRASWNGPSRRRCTQRARRTYARGQPIFGARFTARGARPYNGGWRLGPDAIRVVRDAVSEVASGDEARSN